MWERTNQYEIRSSFYRQIGTVEPEGKYPVTVANDGIDAAYRAALK